MAVTSLRTRIDVGLRLGLQSAALGLCLLASSRPLAGQDRGKLPPFLEDFRGNKEPEIAARTVRIRGTLHGYLVRPDTGERLPGILLIEAGDGRDEWYQLSARELSSIGYVVLAVNERRQDVLRSALDWLRARKDVIAERIGVLGWGGGGQAALRLASAQQLQGCVSCDGLLPEAELAGLQSAVLGVFSNGDEQRAKRIRAFRDGLTRAGISSKVMEFPGIKEGFMGPPESAGYARKQAEEAWLQIYEFFGKHVEDAGEAGSAASPGIAQLMRSVNSPTGLRGLLIRALETEPRGDAGWRQARALAAMISEGAGILERLTPPRGDKGHWRQHTATFRAAAEKTVRAADLRDYRGTRQALETLGNRCAACHREHR